MSDKGDNVVSIVDILKKNAEEDPEEGIIYTPGEYPIFEGTVLSISGQISSDGETYSVIEYVPIGTEVSGAATTPEDSPDKEEANLEVKLHRATVPFSVHPEILIGAEVITYIDQLGDNGNICTTYVLEIIKVHSPYAGFKYLKSIE